MYIPFQRYARRRMSQHLAEGLYFKPDLDAPCGEGMAQDVKMHVINAAILAEFFYPELHGARLDTLRFASRQQKRVRRKAAHFFLA